MDSENLLKHISRNFHQGYPFAIYSLPSETNISGIFQSNNRQTHGDPWNENGFLMVPFHAGEPLFIPENESDRISMTLPEFNAKSSHIQPYDSKVEQSRHEALVASAIHEMENGPGLKIVLARSGEIDIRALDWELLITRLFGLYPNAFRYISYHPEHGLWCGATPEVLLKVRGEEFSTMSLAGTKIPNAMGEVQWTQKELEEQKIVTQFVTELLKDFTAEMDISEVNNHKAGKMVHLRTDFRGKFFSRQNIVRDAIHALHPTPAVCGLPRDMARDFILKNEHIEREFYTGYLGPIRARERIFDLFVNLRCMKIVGNKAKLYAGGGITQASVPTDEWQETQNKLSTMLQVIQPMLA